MLLFKTPEERSEWESGNVPWQIRRILEWLTDHALREHGSDVTVTEVYRSPAEDAAIGATSTTHSEWRAVDIRIVRNIGVSESIRALINRKFPCAVMQRVPPILHRDRHGELRPPHFHIQVSRAEKAQKEPPC